MKFFASMPVLLFSVVMFGCGGGSSSSPISQPTPYPNITGNWSLSGSSSSGTWIAGGYISNSGGSVNGTIHMLNSSCFNINSDVAFTGTISKSGTISMTSLPVANQVITVSGTMSSTNLSGTYSVSGGCANGDKGAATGFSVPSFTNTYTGDFISISGVSVPVKFTIIQTTNADIHGLYQISGTATFTSKCFSTGSVTNSAVVGGFMEVVISTDNNGAVQFIGQVADSTAKTIAGSYIVTAGACMGDQGSGSVSHQ